MASFTKTIYIILYKDGSVYYPTLWDASIPDEKKEVTEFETESAAVDYIDGLPHKIGKRLVVAEYILRNPLQAP